MLIQSPGTVVEEGVFVSPGIHVSLEGDSVLKKGTRIVLAEGSYNEGRKPVSLTIHGTTVEGDILIDCSMLPVLASKWTTAVRLASTTIKGRLWLKFRGYACLGSSIDLNDVVLDGSLIVRNYSFQRDFEAIIRGSYLEPNHAWMGVGIYRSKIYGSCSVTRKGLTNETPAHVFDCKALGMSELVIDHYRGFRGSSLTNKGRLTSQEWEAEKKREVIARHGSRNSMTQAAHAERSFLDLFSDAAARTNMFLDEQVTFDMPRISTGRSLYGRYASNRTIEDFFYQPPRGAAPVRTPAVEDSTPGNESLAHRNRQRQESTAAPSGSLMQLLRRSQRPATPEVVGVDLATGDSLTLTPDRNGNHTPRVREYMDTIRTHLLDQSRRGHMSLAIPQLREMSIDTSDVQQIPHIIRRVLDEEDRIVLGRPIDESAQEAIIGTSNWLRSPRTE